MLHFYHSLAVNKKNGLPVLLFLLAFALTPGKAKCQDPVSGTFTINSALPTDATNFQTVTEAVFSLGFGVNGPVVFNVVPGSGPYVEQVNINAVTGASAVNTITFNGNGATLENTSTNPISRAVLKLDGAKYVTINNFNIHPVTTATPDSYGWGVALLRDADYNTIKNCTITLGVVNSMFPQANIGLFIGGTDDYPESNGLSNCDNNIIDSNTISGGYDAVDLNSYAGNFGVPFTSMDNNQVTNNTISNFVHSGIHITWNNGTLVQGNDISFALFQSCDGIQVDEKNINLKINGNRIHNVSTDPSALDNNFKGITFTYCSAEETSSNIISNNIIYDIRSTGEQRGINIDNCAYVNVVHNTVVLDGSAAVSGTISGLFYTGGNKQINFLDNIIKVSQTGSASGYGINAEETGVDVVTDYNDVIVSGSNSFGNYTGTGYPDLAAWQAGTFKDLHSASQDPLFTDAATGNYKPTNPAMDNIGVFAGITADILGEIKNNNTPDVGAYEFLTPPCNTPIIAGTPIGIPAEATCGGGRRTLNLSGNSFGTGQTYQWQSSSTLNGVYSNVSSSLVVPVFDINPATPTYYRALLGCGPATAFSDTFLIGVNQPMTGTYTINSALPTGGNNYQSFGAAVRNLKCGIVGPVVFDVASGSGPYNEQVIIDSVNGSSAVNTITFNGNGAVVNFLSLNTSERAVIKLNGADYVTIDSLTVNALGTGSSGSYGFGIQLLNGATHNVVSHCVVNISTASNSANLAGILINSSATESLGSSPSYCDYNKISGNTVTGGYYGIVLYSSAADQKMYFDTVSNNIIKDPYAYGIYALGTSHLLVEGNDISRPARVISGSTTLNGIGFNNASFSLVVSKNRIHGSVAGTPGASNPTVGIVSNNCDAPADSVNIISNNIIYDFAGSGSQLGISNSNSDNTLYYHNTVLLDDATQTPTSTARGLHQTGTAAGLQYRNNNVVIKRSGTGINHGIYLNSTGTSFAASNNNYFVAGAGTNNIGFRASTSSTTLTDWQTATGSDSNSTNVDPVFADVLSGNLSPTSLAMDNKGFFVGITTDIIDVPRSSTTPDIGAYEFSGVLPVSLSSFSVTKSESNALISWVTAIEYNTSHFIIEHSVDGSVFSDAGTVTAAGNSSVNRAYGFTDKNAAGFATNAIVYYRLRIADRDGSFKYSPVIAVRFDKKDDLIASVAPNPFVSVLSATISTGRPGKATIQVKDIAGRPVRTQSIQIPAGTTVVNIDGVNGLPKGVYVIAIEINGYQYLKKLVK